MNVISCFVSCFPPPVATNNLGGCFFLLGTVWKIDPNPRRTNSFLFFVACCCPDDADDDNADEDGGALSIMAYQNFDPIDKFAWSRYVSSKFTVGSMIRWYGPELREPFLGDGVVYVQCAWSAYRCAYGTDFIQRHQ